MVEVIGIQVDLASEELARRPSTIACWPRWARSRGTASCPPSWPLPPVRRTESSLTLCWREMDSNLRSLTGSVPSAEAEQGWNQMKYEGSKPKSARPERIVRIQLSPVVSLRTIGS